jgi:hypothetical protein
MAPPRFPDIDLSRLKTCPLSGRPSKVTAGDLGAVRGPDATVGEFLAALPNQLAVRSFRQWRDAICEARLSQWPVVAALGGHVVKTGCSSYLIDWVRRDVLTALALNGAAAVHDVELALAGHTNEDVEARLPEGQFGMTRDTAEFFAHAAARARQTGSGLGAALGAALLDAPCTNPEVSLLRAAAELGIPCTVHVAIGTDVVHIHPCTSGADLGEATLRDFRLLCAVVADLAGGVWMNLGSSVLLPEVFLKAVSVAHNLGYDLRDLTTVDLDMIRSHRARVNVLDRPGGRALALTGHHELMIPLIHAAVAARLAEEGRSA